MFFHNLSPLTLAVLSELYVFPGRNDELSWLPSSSSSGILTSLRCLGPGEHERDAGSVRANVPVAADTCIYYWEVEIKSQGREGFIGKACVSDKWIVDAALHPLLMNLDDFQ